MQSLHTFTPQFVLYFVLMGTKSYCVAVICDSVTRCPKWLWVWTTCRCAIFQSWTGIANFCSLHSTMGSQERIIQSTSITVHVFPQIQAQASISFSRVYPWPLGLPQIGAGFYYFFFNGKRRGVLARVHSRARFLTPSIAAVPSPTFLLYYLREPRRHSTAPLTSILSICA